MGDTTIPTTCGSWEEREGDCLVVSDIDFNWREEENDHYSDTSSAN